MAKLKNDPIGKNELLDYLNTSSDFAFELRCLKRLTELGFQCQHGGFYTDPVSKKTRQFDIRAQKTLERITVRCAIECKRLKESFPLLVMCVPRAPDESFHDLVLSYHPDMVRRRRDKFGEIALPPAFQRTCNTWRAISPHSTYRSGEPVGKSCSQVGITNEGVISASDAEAFEKWSQALASANDIAEDVGEAGKAQNAPVLSLILPILVVPDQTLWRVDFEADGTKRGDPIQVDRCSYFVGQNFRAGALMFGSSFVVSHLEFVTLSGLDTLLQNVLLHDNEWFPIAKLLGATLTDQAESVEDETQDDEEDDDDDDI